MLAHESRGVAVRPLAEGRIEREVFLLTRTTRPPALAVVTEALTDAARTALGSAAHR